MSDALGRNHRFETAVADLVDNSIDAGAQNILLRVVTKGPRAVQFLAVDDGKGISEDAIDTAMTVGGERSYDDTDLGHFGWGLKAASTSQADSFTVMSQAAHSGPVGRRWQVQRARTDFGCGVVEGGYVAQQLAFSFDGVKEPRTIVRWDGVRAFPNVGRRERTDELLEDLLSRLDHHLGLVFHRFIHNKGLRIWMDVLDADTGESSGASAVSALDPFGYLRTGRFGFPREMSTRLGSANLSFTCHIWPGRSTLHNFKLPGPTADHFQGFFIYRRDRLLQAGGTWNSVLPNHRRLQLARVSLDLDERHLQSGHFRMNPEKTRVEVGPDFAPAVQKAKCTDGTRWDDYLEQARETFKASNARDTSRKPVVKPGRGLAPKVRDAVGREYEFTSDSEISVRWAQLTDESFFAIDRRERTIWLNRDYRWAVVGNAPATLNDAPLVKALVYLLAQELFQGAHLGPRDKDNIGIWQAILTAAVKVQEE